MNRTIAIVVAKAAFGATLALGYLPRRTGQLTHTVTCYDAYAF